MDMQKIKYSGCFIVLLMSFVITLTCPDIIKGADIPSAWDVATRKADLPSIEDLTGGMVKKGDIIDKNNMDLVKEFLTPGIVEAMNQGMKMFMGKQLHPDMGVPESVLEATEKNRGKALMDENGTVYYEKTGVPWPGGIPFPEPKNGLEVMANKKFGVGADDYYFNASVLFINHKGECYKKMGLDLYYMWCNTRTDLTPLGAYPGSEEIMYKRISVMTSPLEVKGLGQYTVRYYDDTKQYDTGFMYFPSFKRTMRISATTWQDNMGGSDFTYGDGNGFQEPYSNWTFNLVGTRYILIPEPKASFPLSDDKGMYSRRLVFDEGKKYPRIGWAVTPVHVVEAIPKINHVYGKKILYILSAPYFNPDAHIQIADSYDKQMKLWKLYVSLNGDYNEAKHYYMMYGVFLNDLMTGHMTQYWYKINMNKGIKAEDLGLKTLMEKGR